MKSDVKAEEQAEGASSLPTALAATLRNRHAKVSTEAPRSASSAPSAAVAPLSTEPPRTTGATLKSALLCIGFGAFSFGCLLFAFLAVQVVVLDEMDLGKTAARLDAAGRGEVWFPVWIGNVVVDSVTASRLDEEESRNLGGVVAAPSRKIKGPAPPPPPRLRASSAKPTLENKDPRTGSSISSTPPADASTATSASLRCYTLEAYSETFLQPLRKASKDHFFSCGTRVSDLRTDDRPAVLAACEAHTIYPKYGQAAAQHSHFPTLRVVLTLSEDKRHRDIQPVNMVTQRIPLSRVNDDYCDCMDGTDELLTNACSMSGPLFPVAGSRWKPYLISNQAIQLYDTPDALEQADTESRGFPVVPRKRGDVGDRLHVSQGPVLPFVCMCGAVRQLLAPSLVGDGVVDCCNGEDEAVLQGSPFVAPPLFTNNPPRDQAGQDRAIAAARADMQHAWSQRQSTVTALLAANSAVSYADALFPYHTSAQALLVDKGYYSLFPSHVVQAERKAAATMLKDIYTRGHDMQRRRAQKGWKHLGRSLTENRTRLQKEVANITAELENLERFVHDRMTETRASHPMEAGIPMDMLQYHDRLAHAHQSMQMELQHMVVATIHHAYGDHYEYYPLVRKALAMPSENVTDANKPRDLYRAIAEERAKRVVSPSGLERMAVSARQRGEPMPSLHMDNISAEYLGVELMRHTMAAQKFDATEAPYVAQQLGLLPRGSSTPFDPTVFDKITDPFLRAPVLPLGSWQPYGSERDGHSMQLADPAGDVHLAARACVTPASPLYRGGGRLQFPTRLPEPPRRITIDSEEDEKKSLKEKLKSAADGTQTSGQKVEIPYHFHMPSVFAVDRYVGSLRCNPGPLPASASHRYSRDDDRASTHEGDAQREPTGMVQIYVTTLCDTKDHLLFWGRNGKCTQEVVVGTPSACTAWALKAARDTVNSLTS